jgi:hypothetical protein
MRTSRKKRGGADVYTETVGVAATCSWNALWGIKLRYK